jgi:hypothetical protein
MDTYCRAKQVYQNPNHMYQKSGNWKPIAKVYDYGKDNYYLGIPKEYVVLQNGIKIPYYGHYWRSAVKNNFS